ncbi:MAG: hypothetical protein ACI9R3_002541 [Verrucomicrobiales bacterium]|jgi:hypothetical protein
MEEIVSLQKLKELAVLFDHSVNALDPESPQAKEAEVHFDRKIEELHTGVPPQIPLATFRARVRFRCRQFLNKDDN